MLKVPSYKVSRFCPELAAFDSFCPELRELPYQWQVSLKSAYFKEKDVSHQKLAKLIQYIFCLPGTNASSERVFSQMNKIWTADKTQLSVSTLKSLLLLKCNFKQSCLEFYNFLKSSPELLKKIISIEKYKQ